MNFISPGAVLLSQVTVDTDLDMLNQDIDIGTGEIQGSLYTLKENVPWEGFSIHDAALTGYRDLVTRAMYSGLYNTNVDAGVLSAKNADDSSLTLKAQDNGVGQVGVAKVFSAASPSFDLLSGRLTGALQCNGQNLVGRTVVAGDYIVASADTERIETGVSYVKIKEIQVGIAGTFRVSFDMKNFQGTQYSYGQIYKNGGAVGTERFGSLSSYVTYSEDLTFAIGDLVQLYVKSTHPTSAYFQNFRLGVTDDLAHTVNTD